jgi:glycosyltransferase involved in cell wall biosynthesis
MSTQEVIQLAEITQQSATSHTPSLAFPIESLLSQKKLKINFNTMGLELSGGSRVILETATRMQSLGHKVTINAVGRKGDADWFGSLGQVKINYKFPARLTRLMQQKILHRNFRDVQTDLLGEMASDADCDANVATFCLTAQPTFENSDGNGFYLVQNYEPDFFAETGFREKAEKSYNLPLKKLCVSRWLQQKVGGVYIGNGVNTKVFHPRVTYEEKESNSIVYLFRGISWKGDDLALETMRLLHKSLPKVNIHIVARKYAHIKADFPYQLHVDPADEELAKIYSQVQVLLFASSFEGYGLPPLEAMASGTNVVSTDFSGNEYLADGVNCYLAQTAVGLANGAVKLMTRPDEAKMQLENAKQTVKEHDFDLVTKRVLNQFQLSRRI